MKTAKTIEAIRAAVADARGAGAGRLGLVPTMGALHDGHYSLIDAARAECDFVVVSIFVNPTQFGPGEDFATYPRTLESDLAGCRHRGVDAVFAPGVEEMYPPGETAKTVHVVGLSDRLCGAHRPGHFDGVCTVVARLLDVVAPDVAYFGAKDYQQSVIIARMVDQEDIPVTVAVRQTVREADGLAISSRNARLGPEQRTQAAALYQSLRLAERLVGRGVRRAAELTRHVRDLLAERAPLGEID
ncbi:hypothetical protein LCGC14_2716730, partial [marine sediment metagenome]